jgi:hypothetical protein
MASLMAACGLAAAVAVNVAWIDLYRRVGIGTLE